MNFSDIYRVVKSSSRTNQSDFVDFLVQDPDPGFMNLDLVVNIQ